MKETGLSGRAVKRMLRAALKDDRTFGNGRIIGSMCTAPHPFAARVFSRYLGNNVGDPGLFPGSIALEAEAIRSLGALLSLPDAHGYVVTGGTEANILALWAARESAGGRGREVLVSEAAHFSFDKAARMLELELVKLPLRPDHTVDTAAARKRLSARTIALVGIAGTTDLGVIDPIEELSRLAVEKGIYLHVDAALGGFVIPFARELGRKVNAFDFSLPGVQSVTIDPHKMGMAPIPAGGILFRSGELSELVRIKVPYLSGGETALATIVGTRSGASVLAVWALLEHLGRRGYRAVVARAYELTDYLAAEVRKISGLTLAAEPVINVVGIAATDIPCDQLAARLREKGWAVSLFPDHLRVVLMPHLRLKHIRRLVADLRAVVATG
jgi:tyrosine decarboxylase/aspartate 1-decarboxylase